MPLQHFLIIYDTKAQELLDALNLGVDADAATEAYSRCEEEYRYADGIEVVLIGADSLDTVRRTHSHYFDAVDDFFNRVVA